MITFHAGLHKTGTSAIQTALKESRLHKAGALYWGADRQPAEADPFDYHNAFRIKQLSQDFDVIHSDEGLLGTFENAYSDLPSRARALVDQYDDAEFQVILHVRPQHEWTASAYSQLVKSGGTSSAEDFCDLLLRSPRIRWTNMVNEIASTIGSQRLIVRPYLPNIDAPQQFFDLLGLGKVPSLLAGKQSNPALTPEKALVLRALNEKVSPEHQGIVRYAVEHSEAHPPVSSMLTMLPERQRKQLVRLFLEDWRELPDAVNSTKTPRPAEFNSVGLRDALGGPDAQARDLLTSRSLDEALQVIEYLLPRAVHDPWSQSLVSQVKEKLRQEPADLPAAVLRRLGRSLRRPLHPSRGVRPTV